MIDYKKYRWFYTSNKTLVVGGKNAEQNDFLLKELQRSGKDYLVMHTTRPRSPFSVILKEIEIVAKAELEECATFTACFSSAWKDGVTRVEVDIFKLSQLSKGRGFKEGMWRIKGDINKIKVKLELGLVVQENTLRAVPIKSISEPLKTIMPGNLDKERAAELLSKELLEFSKQDLLSALPTGGIKIK